MTEQPKFTVVAGDDVVMTRSRYRELLAAEDKLARLEAYGVDNWQGYDEAMRGGEKDED